MLEDPATYLQRVREFLQTVNPNPALEQINRIGADEVLTANQAGGRIMSSLAALTAASTMGNLPDR